MSAILTPRSKWWFGKPKTFKVSSKKLAVSMTGLFSFLGLSWALFLLTTFRMILCEIQWKTLLSRVKIGKKIKKLALISLKGLLMRKLRALISIGGETLYWRSLLSVCVASKLNNTRFASTFSVAVLADAVALIEFKGSLTSKMISWTFAPWWATQLLWKISSVATSLAKKGSY